MSQQESAELLQAFNQFNQVSDALDKSFELLNETVSTIAQAAGHDQPVRDSAAVNQHLRELVDAIPGAVIVLNANGQVVDFNIAAAELLGDLQAEQYWRDIVSRAFLPDLDQGELRTPDGRQFSISTRPLGYQPGQILLLSDVTQTRQLQRAAQQNLHLMTMGKMMASLAHQIRTPLSSTMLYLSQIAEGNLDQDKNQKFTAKALARVKHIEKTINDMLMFAHGGQFHMADFPVAELMHELEDQLQPQLKLHQSRLHIDTVDPAISINGNKDALLGAVLNLAMNAMHAGQQAVDIHIKVALTDQGRVAIDIRDNACGMDEHTLAHLFDPFFTTKTDGTGLGLAVVKSVVESHQGHILVESTPDQGSCFAIHLPSPQANKTQLSKED